MMTRQFVCPGGCKPDCDTPFYYPPAAWHDEVSEHGILAYPDGSPSNRWTDGTAGVPYTLAEIVSESDYMPLCIECHEESTHALAMKGGGE